MLWKRSKKIVSTHISARGPNLKPDVPTQSSVETSVHRSVQSDHTHLLTRLLQKWPAHPDYLVSWQRLPGAVCPGHQPASPLLCVYYGPSWISNSRNNHEEKRLKKNPCVYAALKSEHKHLPTFYLFCFFFFCFAWIPCSTCLFI